MSALKEFTVYFWGPSPNPWKVAIVLEELGLPWKFQLQMDVKAPDYVKLNPNGRVPTLIDPNKDITIWESGAIIEYLLEEYDTEKKLQLTSFQEKNLLRSWAFYQVSGQGPYFGQKGWFSNHHPEKLPSAIERYATEVKRVTKVVDSWLEEKGTDYLVGNTPTYADLMWVPYYKCFKLFIAPESEIDLAEYKHLSAWLERLYARPAVGKVLGQWEHIAEQALKGPPPKH